MDISDIPQKYLHQSGMHKGRLNQALLQRDGEFFFRDPHPDVKGLYFLAFNKTQKAPQRWGLESQLPKESDGTYPKGIPSKFIVRSTRGRQGLKIGNLDQDALQIEGEFRTGDPHPLCKLIIFRGLRIKGFPVPRQRWSTLEQYEYHKEYARIKQREWYANRTPERIEEDRIKQQERHAKLWSDPVWAEAERERRRKCRANRTPEQIARDRARDKAYREANPEKVRERRKRDYENNKETYIKQATVWNKKNKDRRNANNRTRHAVRFFEEPEYRILLNLRQRLRRAVVGDRIRRLAVRELCGCSRKQLKKHLESLFAKGMSWENYGVDGWHIDHIRPCASFDLNDIEEQKKCFHYTNLQPLWAEDNLRKGAKYDES